MKAVSLRVTALSLGLLASGWAAASTYVVDRYQDDQNQGSLRWAIEQSNANPSDDNQILIQAVGKAPYRIKVNSPLPEIKGPVKIIGTQWDKTGEFIAIDGSNYIQGEGAKACPGAVLGQYQRTHDDSAGSGTTRYTSCCAQRSGYSSLLYWYFGQPFEQQPDSA
jgi:3-dehydroshikimate dehydratase